MICNAFRDSRRPSGHDRLHQRGRQAGSAVEHLDGFRSELEAWYATDPMHVVSQPNPDRRSADLYFQVSNPMPSTLNVLLGDSVHNLRSALDHLAMALAVDNGANPYDRFISFPICKDFKAFHGHDEQQPPRPPSNGLEPTRSEHSGQPHRLSSRDCNRRRAVTWRGPYGSCKS